MEQLKPIIQRKARQLAGQSIKCRNCENEAVIIFRDARFMVFCYAEGVEYLLKEQHATSPSDENSGRLAI